MMVHSVDTDPWSCHLRAVCNLIYMNVNLHECKSGIASSETQEASV